MAVGILFDEAGGNAIHRGPARREVDRERLGQRLHPGLGGSRCGEAHDAAREGMGHEGGDADHAPARARLDQAGFGRCRELKESRGHDGERGIPGGPIDLANQAAVGETCVAHHHVEAAEALGRVIDQSRRRAGRAEIALDYERLRA